MLTGLRIQNFKGIEGPITVPIKPVTLLFGVNSAGKSSVLHSLHFIRSVLERHDLDPAGSPFAADDIDLGGFLNLLHKQKPGRRMVLGYELDLATTDLPEYGATTALSVSDASSSAYIEFGFSADDQDRSARIDYYLVAMNGDDIALVMPDEIMASDGGIRNAFVNLRHPLLSSLAQSNDGGEESVEASLSLRKLIPISQAEYLARADISDPLEAESQKNAQIAEYERNRRHPDLLSLKVNGFRSGLPPWGKLVSMFDDVEQDEGDDEPAIISPQVLSELIVGPLEVLRDLLGASRAVGPLRAIPPRRLALDSKAKESYWYGGLAAWHRLHECSDTQFQEVSNWLESTNHLGTGYGLVRQEAREVPQHVLDSLSSSDETSAFQYREAIEQAPVVKRVLLTDTLNGVQVTPHDVGVGLSQLIPVVVAAVDRIGDLVLIEQPELHIHPKVQVGLGDLFLGAAHEYKRNFLIETHSEAMLLRMMRRIRQTQDGELPVGLPPSAAEDVAVYLIQNEGQGVTITRMQLNRRGELVKPWPKGLFEESLRETF
jgi:hypothetical protein